MFVCTFSALRLDDIAVANMRRVEMFPLSLLVARPASKPEFLPRWRLVLPSPFPSGEASGAASFLPGVGVWGSVACEDDLLVVPT